MPIDAGERPHPVLSLLDWRRRIQEMYAAIRADQDPHRAWVSWREQRDDLFRRHPQSPLREETRDTFAGISYFDYKDAWRVEATFEPTDEAELELPGSTGAPFEAARSGRALFELEGKSCSLDLFWITGYGGGAFLSFRDATTGRTTYGGGRYLLDTIKGADLGAVEDRLILDFNFAYNPSCSYDPRWSCPLPPSGNRLDAEIAAGEKI